MQTDFRGLIFNSLKRGDSVLEKNGLIEGVVLQILINDYKN